jgi:hypothetical protein
VTRFLLDKLRAPPHFSHHFFCDALRHLAQDTRGGHADLPISPIAACMNHLMQECQRWIGSRRILMDLRAVGLAAVGAGALRPFPELCMREIPSHRRFPH